MSNTDNYDFAKSMASQDPSKYTPYVDKQSNLYINDINSGVYSSGQTLVQFDLSSLYNSSRWVNTDDMFLTIPLTLVSCKSVAGSAPAVVPPTAGWALACLKSGYHNLIHQADLQVDGRTIADTQPFLGTMLNVKFLSEMSQDDMKSTGTSLGFSDVIDNHQSVVWNGTTATANGTGLTNNLIWNSTGTSSNSFQGSAPTATGNQNQGCINEAVSRRVARVVDTSKAGFNKIIGNLVSGDQMRQDFKPTYQVLGTNYGVVYDTAVIRLKDLFDCMNNIGLVKRFNGILRLYVNTGSLYVGCQGNNLVPNYSFSSNNTNFQNVCPVMINNLNAVSADGGIAASQTQVSVGLFIGKALQTNLNGVNLGSSNASHPMNACRCYYSSITLTPQRALEYETSNRAKQVVYRNMYFNQYNAIGNGASWSQMVQSGITNPYAVIIIPYISSTATGMSGAQFQSPFDTAPATGSPCILQNLSVSLGGVQQLTNPLYYGYETYLTQFSSAEAMTSGDFGVNTGLVNQAWWESNRIYYVNLSRGTPADKLTPRNLNISFSNQSLVPIDVQIFTIYLDELTIDVASANKKHFNIILIQLMII